MEESNRWLRLITISLILAALAIGYFLLTGRFSSNSSLRQKEGGKAVSSPSPSVLGQNTKPSPVPTPESAYSRIVNRTQSNVQTLPRTGFPVSLAIIFSASAMISGWGLRKFPN